MAEWRGLYICLSHLFWAKKLTAPNKFLLV
jgi:hypothetical protein